MHDRNAFGSPGDRVPIQDKCDSRQHIADATELKLSNIRVFSSLIVITSVPRKFKSNREPTRRFSFLKHYTYD